MSTATGTTTDAVTPTTTSGGMTPRERFIAALERKPFPGRVPTFELVFFLTMETFGQVHPSHRNYEQWLQMTDEERQLHREEMAELYIKVAERYQHDAIFLHPNPNDLDETRRLIDAVRNHPRGGDTYFLMLHGDSTLAIPDGAGMEEMSLRMVEEPEKVDAQAREWMDIALKRAEALQEHGALDGFALCSDYCFNSGPFMPPDWFDRFVTPYLHDTIRAYKEMGFYVIKHTDGNIMPILDRLVPEDPSARPHALHSLDPQGGVDLTELVQTIGDKVCLCGNVNCGLLQTGTDEESIADAERSIREGLAAPGYIFATSNCVYTGMPLRRYEMIHEVYLKQAVRSV